MAAIAIPAQTKTVLNEYRILLAIASSKPLYQDVAGDSDFSLVLMRSTDAPLFTGYRCEFLRCSRRWAEARAGM
jgi:hypothetical protein